MAVTKSLKRTTATSSLSKVRRANADTKARLTLNMRIRPEMRNLIDHAALLCGKNRTDFVLDAARLAAHNAVLDQTVIRLNAKAHAEFMALLDTAPKANPPLRKSLNTKPVWE